MKRPKPEAKGNPIPDLTGKTFGYWTVLRFSGWRARIYRRWHCRCICGEKRYVMETSMLRGWSRSCGCVPGTLSQNKNRKHGMMHSREWIIWDHMKSRCNQSSNHAYRNYGGRGIAVCKRWNKFQNFFADMGKAPVGKSLERKNNHKGYDPDNCIWATPKEQMNNTRRTRFLKLGGVRMSVTQWADELKIPRGTIHSRIRRGYSARKCLCKSSRPSSGKVKG